MSAVSTVDRLFVPLARRPFEYFESEVKTIELRKFNVRRWHWGNIRKDRRVELRLGYSGRSLWGVITEVWGDPTIEDAFRHEEVWRSTIPWASSQSDAYRYASELLRIPVNEGAVILFRVNLMAP